MRLENKTVAMLVGPGFEELEFWVPYMRMKEEGAHVKIVGIEHDRNYDGKHGWLPVKSYYIPGDIKIEDTDAVLIPGGWAPDKLRREEAVLNLVRSAYMAGKIIGMICHAGQVGVSAGIVKDKKATGSLGIKADLENAGATWVDEPAFQDGNLVWGRVARDIPEYCRELVQAIEKGSTA